MISEMQLAQNITLHNDRILFNMKSRIQYTYTACSLIDSRLIDRSNLT